MTDSQQFGFDNRIAPREEPPATAHFLEEMLRGAYDHGTVLRYHDYRLCHLGETENVWRVEHAVSGTDADAIVEVLNLGSVESLTTLETTLSTLADVAPRTHGEWRAEQCDGPDASS